LANAGVRVAVNGRNAENAQRAAKQLGENAVAIPGDVSTSAGRKVIMEQVRQQLGDISILVTNAGGPPPGPVDQHDHKTWVHALETNMLSAIDFAVMCLPYMKAAGFGRIVNITSFTVREPYANMGLATSVRAGLTGAMSSLAKEVAPFGITVNNVLPGLMDTGALERVYKAQSEREGISIDTAKARMAESVPMQRLGRADDFGHVCAFMCSRHAGYMTGQNITVDGGLVKSLL
jgi:3-oxoacyl-[acyl-carrier protein] reductase